MIDVLIMEQWILKIGCETTPEQFMIDVLIMKNGHSIMSPQKIDQKSPKTEQSGFFWSQNRTFYPPQK